MGRITTSKEQTVRFLSIYKAVETNTPPSPDHMAKMQKLVEDAMKAGWLLATEGCLPSAMGACVRRAGGTITVADGPFTGSKEVTGGFAILRASSKAEAIELTKTFLALAGDGECEVRQIFTPTDETAGCMAAELTQQFANA
jgi:hypothetical protein